MKNLLWENEYYIVLQVRTHFVKTIMRTRLEEARYQAAAAHTSYLPGQLGYLAHLYNSTDTAGASCWGETAANTWDPTPSTQAWLQNYRYNIHLSTLAFTKK